MKEVRVDTEDGPLFIEVVESLDPSIGVAPWTWDEWFANQWECIPQK